MPGAEVPTVKSLIANPETPRLIEIEIAVICFSFLQWWIELQR